MNIKYLIGIDPGRNTGYCLYDKTNRKIESLQLLDFWKAIQSIQYLKKNNTDFEVVIEDPQLNKPTFTRHVDTKLMLKIAQDVGRNKEQAFLLIEYMNLTHIKHRTVQPKSEKWDAKYFKKLTNWQGTSNEHTRDAAKLVWGY